jgi:hypothetical protein
MKLSVRRLGMAAFASLTLAAITAPHLNLVDAQDVDAKSNYGGKQLDCGFTPDPFVVSVVAGGPLEVKKNGFTQYISNAPDFRLIYKAGNRPLIFRATSNSDTALLVNLPDGTWVADDDSGGNLNPMIRIEQPKSGRYEIWVGTIQKSQNPTAILSISEVK